jgi:hypothetical protein
MKVVTGEQAAQHDSKEKFKKDSSLSQSQFTDIFMTLVKTAAEAFKDKWNAKEGNQPIDIRFVTHKNAVKGHPQIKAQAMLVFEVRAGYEWKVMSRTVQNFGAERMLRDMETEYTFKLWSDMFSEITQIGFVSIINFIFAKESGNGTGAQAGTQDRQSSIISGDIETIEDLSTKG